MKIIKQGQDARDALKRGVDLVADCIKCTLGPAGRNAVLGRNDIPPIITNDGATIARNIVADNEIENEGVKLVMEATAITDNSAGDGTTTTTVLLQAIVNELFEQLRDDGSMVKKSKVNAIKLKRDVDEWCLKVIEKLNEKARPITKKDIYNVAIVSGEYEWIAKIVSEVYEKIGNSGYVSIEEGVKTEYEVFKGIKLPAGYTSEYFINNDKRQCISNSPKILVTNNKIDTSSMDPLLKIISQLIEQKITDLIIVAPEFSPDIINRFIATKVNNTGFNIIALRVPTFDKNDFLLDICSLTQANLIDKNVFIKFADFSKEFNLENLGSADRAVIGDSESVIYGGNGDTKIRVKELKKQYEQMSSVFDKDAMEKRMAYLSGGVAVIKISGESEFEKGYFKLKLEDAVNAVQIALVDGVVKGGGLALKEISEELPKNILSNSLKAPYEQIQKNYGDVLIIKDSVIDPVKTTISALKSACSVAGTLITTEVAVAFKREKDESKN